MIPVSIFMVLLGLIVLINPFGHLDKVAFRIGRTAFLLEEKAGEAIFYVVGFVEAMVGLTVSSINCYMAVERILAGPVFLANALFMIFSVILLVDSLNRGENGEGLKGDLPCPVWVNLIALVNLAYGFTLLLTL